mgnify:FL=1
MLFIQQSKSAVQGFLQTIPALDGLCFRPSRLKEIHLSAFAGPNALSIVQATPALFCQRGLEEKEGEDLFLSAVDGYVNLTFPLP